MLLTKHITQQAARKGIPLAVITKVLANPAITYPSFTKDANGKRVPRTCRKHPEVQGEKWTGDGDGIKICLTVYPCCGEVSTVWLDQVETDLRPDQIANGVTGYKGRDGRWRS